MHIFAVTIRWSEDTPSKEEYASQFFALFFHAYSIYIFTYTFSFALLVSRFTMIKWLIDFKGMSNRQELFHAKKQGNFIFM